VENSSQQKFKHVEKTCGNEKRLVLRHDSSVCVLANCSHKMYMSLLPQIYLG